MNLQVKYALNQLFASKVAYQYNGKLRIKMFWFLKNTYQEKWYIHLLVRRPFWLWGVCIYAFLYKKNLEERKEDHWSYIFLHISIRTSPYLTKIRKWTIIGRKVALQVIRFDCGMKEAKYRPLSVSGIGCYYWVKKVTVLNSYLN